MAAPDPRLAALLTARPDEHGLALAVTRGDAVWLELAVEDDAVRGQTLGDSFALYAGADGAFRDGDYVQWRSPRPCPPSP